MIDRYLGSTIHIRRGDQTIAIPAGLMLSETDMTAAEIASIEPSGVLRRPSAEEWAAVQARQAGETPALVAAPVEHPRTAAGGPGRVKERH